jgi:RimJ/RimL family protein N-acetyltransferase
MSAPHLIPRPGPAAAFAKTLRARLPRIESERCILRAPELEDATHWIEILVADREGHLGGPFTPAAAFTDFAATVGLWLLRGHGLWTVTNREGTVLGFVLIGFEPGDREPELGFLFCAHARGKGYAKEAAAAARAHALGPLGLDALVSYVDPSNIASRRLAERLGARYDGLMGFDGTVERVEVWRHAPEASA